MTKKYLAIIPARGGSKRIPRKNIKNFLGKPIIYYPINTALSTHIFHTVMVSTEDKKIAGIAKKYGAKIPFFRSDKTSDDQSILSDVIYEVLINYKKKGEYFDAFCALLPTAVFVSKETILQGLKILRTKDTDAVITATQYEYPIQRAIRLKNNYVEMLWPENYPKRSQDLEHTYHDAGQLYWMKTDIFLKEKKFFPTKTNALPLSANQVQDIDNFGDWHVAELKYKIMKRKKF